MQQIFKNTFEGGLNYDLDYGVVNQNQYVFATDVSLTNSSGFLSLSNLEGSQTKYDFGFNIDVLHSVGCYFETTRDPHVVLFLYDYSTFEFKIVTYNLVNNTLYNLYKESVSWPYSAQRVFDSVVHSEGGVDTIYFTDNEHEPRKLKCSLRSPYSAWYLTDSDLSLTRKGAVGYVSLNDITTGGNLLSGSYQFAYQALDPSENKYTKWSLLSNPFLVYTSENDSDIVTAGVGLPTEFKILVNVNPSYTELDDYTHFRLAVIENIYPNGIPNTKAVVTPITPWADREGYSYIRSKDYELVDIVDLVLDFQPIEHVRTITTKDSRLLLGGITYKDLEYDNGTPTVDSGSILRYGHEFGGTSESTQANPFSDHVFSSRYKGHFRDEVYRYAVSYFDEDGNYSYPQPLDMSNVTHNTSTQSGFKDMKFPSRSEFYPGLGYYYHPFKADQGGIQSLGLEITLSNHPSWAVGFVILRAKRMKNILFQSPLIPLGEIDGTGAILNYPTVATEGTAEITYSNPIPMEQQTTLYPMNFFKSNISSYKRNSSGEVTHHFATLAQHFMLFPPDFMHYDKDIPLGGYTIKTIDAALLNCEYTDLTDNLPSGVTVGNYIETNIAGTFHALSGPQYYYAPGRASAVNVPRNNVGYKIRNSYSFQNFGEGKQVGDLNILRTLPLKTFEQGRTDSTVWGYNPTVHKSVVVDLGLKITFINYIIDPFHNGQSVYVPSFVEVPEYAPGLYNNHYFTHTGAVYPEYPNVVEIVNVVSNLSDDRYGSQENRIEYISTGTIYTFSEAERAQVASMTSTPKLVHVWGGDCFVGAKTVKITDIHYGTTGPTGGHDPASTTPEIISGRWKRAYENNGGGTLSLPVASRGTAQYIQVVIESEDNPEVMDTEGVTNIGTFGIAGASTGFPIVGANTESAIKTPLSYNYNGNLSKQNSDKLFFSKDPLAQNQTNYAARILYSDPKIYQTTVEGFDLFRINNKYDLDESMGPLSKLIVHNNSLYGVQHTGILYIPVGERTLETADNLTLSIGTGSFINTPTVLSSKIGSNFTRGTVASTRALYVFDPTAKTIMQINGTDIKSIVDGIESYYRVSNYPASLDKSKVFSLYNQPKDELIFGVGDPVFENGASTVYSEKYDKWITTYSFAEYLQTGANINGNFFITGRVGANTYLDQFQVVGATPSTVFGILMPGSVEFVVNPDLEIPKVFDNFIVASTNPIDNALFTVDQNTVLGELTNTVSFTPVAYNEGNYEAKILLDSITGGRLRGSILKVRILFDTDYITKLRGTLTKYRVSRFI